MSETEKAETTKVSSPAVPVLLTAARWLAVLGALYLLISAVSVVGRGFRALGDDTAQQLFSFADNPLVGLAVGILATVLIQSSTTTTAVAVTAVGTGALELQHAIPIIMGANVGTTVTCTFVALGFVGDKADFKRALAGSTIHDFYNLLALAIFLPLELLFHPLQRISGWLTQLLYGANLPNPGNSGLLRTVTSPLVNGVTSILGGIGSQVTGAALVIIAGVAMIFFAVQWLSHFLKILMVGRARGVLTTAVAHDPARAMAAGFGVTLATQSSTVTNSILVPFVGTGTITPKQLYPVTLGANLGTTLTALLAAFAVTGGDARIGLQAAFVHVVYNVLAIIVIFVIPILRPVPLWLATKLGEKSAEDKRSLAAYVVGVFMVLPALVIGLSLLF